MITRKSLMIYENNAVITRNCNRQYDDKFAVSGAKIGETLRIRLPDRALVTDGAALRVQDVNQQSTTLVVATQKHIGLNFTTAEMTMKLDDFSSLYLEPRVSQLAATVDADVATCYKQVYQSVGTPGTTPSTSLVLLQAQQKLNESAVNMSQRYAVVDPAANAALVEGMKGFFNPTDTLSRQFRTGMMGTGVLGYDEISMSQSIATHTTGAWGTTITSTGTLSTEGQATLPISFTGSSKTWKEGDVFTIANVYAVNPQTRRSTGSLQQFVVTADVTGSSTATLAISPAIYTASHALATVDSFPQATAAVTMLGSASTTYPQNLVYQKEAIAFVTADLVLPKGVEIGSRQMHNGVSLRIVQQYDINNDRDPCRLDVLYGYKVVRPASMVRIWG
jgi:hypothetical protein